MRRPHPYSALFGLMLVAACSASSTGKGSGRGGSSGSFNTGGTSSTSVIAGTGGLTATGGATDTGGTTSGSTAAGGTAGTTRTGGAPGSGGLSGTAGVTSAAGSATTGGATGVGGNANTGGATATGGARTGGAPSTGGIATGGTRTGGASGGAPAAGGSAGSGGVGSGGQPGTGGGAGTGGAAGSTGTGALIHNDVFWKDTSSTPIYSQGGGVLQVGSTYYWYGVKYGGAVSYAANPSKSNSDTSFVAVTIYSSTDLATWKFEGNVLTAASLTTAGADPSNWIGRVGAAYNATTKKYVLNGQYLGSPDTSQFFATSDTPNGAFQWIGTQAIITNVTNNNCGDQSIFNDDDGKAYLICSSLSGRSNLYVAPLRAADYLAVDPATRVFGGAGREGNAMFKYAGRYYLCSSDLHGWNSSHSYYISASNILGPYGTEGVIGNTDADFSHVTQTGLFLTVKGSTESTVIFGGDRWSDFAGNGIGFNQWVPLTFNGTTPSMQSLSVWSINAQTGTWAVGPGNNYALNPSFEADRVTIAQPAGWTTSSGTNVSGGHTGNWSWQLQGTSSLDQPVTGLPNGTYTLSAWVKSSGGQSVAQLYAKGFGGTDKTASLGTAMSAWTQVSITGIAVSNGTCDIGVTTTGSTGQTVTIDDLLLVQN